MLESNPPRNSRRQTHQDDEAGGEGETPSPLAKKEHIGLIDLLMPQKTHPRSAWDAMAVCNKLATASWDASHRRRFGAPTSRTAFEHMPMVKDAVEHCSDRRHVA